jgi:hypothetical protein
MCVLSVHRLIPSTTTRRSISIMLVIYLLHNWASASCSLLNTAG